MGKKEVEQRVVGEKDVGEFKSPCGAGRGFLASPPDTGYILSPASAIPDSALSHPLYLQVRQPASCMGPAMSDLTATHQALTTFPLLSQHRDSLRPTMTDVLKAHRLDNRFAALVPAR